MPFKAPDAAFPCKPGENTVKYEGGRISVILCLGTLFLAFPCLRFRQAGNKYRTRGWERCLKVLQN